MAADDRVVVFGEDVPLLRRNLLVRFGPQRVRGAPISEAAFMGAAVGAAMAGLRPVVELMLVDFVGVALDSLLNHAAKLHDFSGGPWNAPLVVRTACGGGYGDGGQHEQCLWGLLGGIPGLAVVVPSCPADAAGLMLSAIAYEGPVVYLEHKLLSDYWLDYLGGASRPTVSFHVPPAGVHGGLPEPMAPARMCSTRTTSPSACQARSPPCLPTKPRTCASRASPPRERSPSRVPSRTRRFRTSSASRSE